MLMALFFLTPHYYELLLIQTLNDVPSMSAIMRVDCTCNTDVYLNEYPKKFIVDPQYIGLFMMLNGKPVTLLFNRSPK